MNNLKKLSVATVGAAVMALGTAGAAPAVTIGNGGIVTDDAAVNFGRPSNATIGQTFTVPTNGDVLNRFSFALNDILKDDNSSPSPVRFSAYVMQWDNPNQRAIGNVLYDSTVPPNVPSAETTNQSDYELFSFNINDGLSLTVGERYVAFLSVSRFFDDNTFGQLAAVGQGTDIDGGGFVYLDNNEQTTQSEFITSLTTGAWIVSDQSDAAFIANFSATAAVPFDFSPGMGILTLGACGAMMQFKKKVQTWKVSRSAFSKS